MSLKNKGVDGREKKLNTAGSTKTTAWSALIRDERRQVAAQFVWQEQGLGSHPESARWGSCAGPAAAAAAAPAGAGSAGHAAGRAPRSPEPAPERCPSRPSAAGCACLSLFILSLNGRRLNRLRNLARIDYPERVGPWLSAGSGGGKLRRERFIHLRWEAGEALQCRSDR